MHGSPAPGAIPDLLGGVKQYNMEAILESCKPTNGQGTQYLIKWLGYPFLKNSWILTSSFATGSKELIYKFHQAHPNNYWVPTVTNPSVQLLSTEHVYTCSSDLCSVWTHSRGHLVFNPCAPGASPAYKGDIVIDPHFNYITMGPSTKITRPHQL